MIKSIIFDMDGVIVDSEPMHADANVKALRQYGLDMPASYYLSFAGTTKYHMMELLIKRHGIDAAPEELCRAADMQNEILFRRDGYTEVPGVCDFIKRLHGSGITLAIASSSPYRDINSVLEYFHIKQYFDSVLSGHDESFKPKPEPDIYLAAISSLGVSADDAAAIEDTDTGLMSAHLAGLACYGYRNINSGNQSLSLACKIIKDYNSIDESFFIPEKTFSD